QGYILSDDNNYLAGNTTDTGSLDFRELGVNATAQVTDRLRVGAQLYGRKLGELESAEVDWAYADYRAADAIGFRAGIIKTPRGLYNELQDLDLATSTVLLPQSVYDLRLRDFQVSAHGGQIYGSIPAGRLGSVDYSLYGGDRHMEADGSVAGFWEQGLFAFDFQADRSSLNWTVGGQAMWNTPLDGLRLGFSYVYYDELSVEGTVLGSRINPAFGASRFATSGVIEGLTSYVLSAEYLFGDLRFASEYTRWTSDLSGEITGVPLLGTIPLPGNAYQPEGWYGQMAWQATDSLELSGTVSLYWADSDNHSTSDPASYQHDYSLAAKYGITDNWIAKAEVHYLRGHGLMFAADNPDGFDSTDVMLAAKTTISF
ncbi:MAG: hypothetical protein RLZZ127_817, partial [Planctomycetota bacterium]